MIRLYSLFFSRRAATAEPLETAPFRKEVSMTLNLPEGADFFPASESGPYSGKFVRSISAAGTLSNRSFRESKCAI